MLHVIHYDCTAHDVGLEFSDHPSHMGINNTYGLAFGYPIPFLTELHTCTQVWQYPFICWLYIYTFWFTGFYTTSPSIYYIVNTVERLCIVSANSHMLTSHHSSSELPRQFLRASLWHHTKTLPPQPKKECIGLHPVASEAHLTVAYELKKGLSWFLQLGGVVLVLAVIVSFSYYQFMDVQFLL